MCQFRPCRGHLDSDRCVGKGLRMPNQFREEGGVRRPDLPTPVRPRTSGLPRGARGPRCNTDRFGESKSCFSTNGTTEGRSIHSHTVHCRRCASVTLEWVPALSRRCRVLACKGKSVSSRYGIRKLESSFLCVTFLRSIIPMNIFRRMDTCTRSYWYS